MSSPNPATLAAGLDDDERHVMRLFRGNGKACITARDPSAAACRLSARGICNRDRNPNDWDLWHATPLGRAVAEHLESEAADVS